MIGSRATSRIGVALVLTVCTTVPLLVGQGCPAPIVEQITPEVTSASGTRNATGNTPPSLQFTAPTVDLSKEVGDSITISWSVSDPDSNAAVTLLLDPDAVFGNNNERVIVPVVFEDSGFTSYVLNTSALNPPLAAGTYRIVARVNDGVNPELLVTATGRLLLLGRGLLPGNVSPRITMTEPALNLGVLQNDIIQLAYCASDADDGANGETPDIIILLDLDLDPSNDIDLTSSSAEANLSDICLTGGFPRTVPGAIVLGCAQKTTDCVNVNNPPNANVPTDPTPFPLAVDVGQIPPRASGDPYYPRATIWDHTNRPVNSYALGTISVTALGSGVVDLGLVGATISGTKFQGFDDGARAGSGGADLGDFDADGADDFVIVEQKGKPSNIGNIGSAHVVFGLPGQKFASEIPLNSVSVTVRGTYLPMYSGGRTGCSLGGDITIPGLTGTDGIVSVTRVGDENGDGRPEILFGMPYVEQFFDYVDDDPCDCGCPDADSTDPPGCYSDLLPNPWSTGCLGTGCADDPVDAMMSHDWREESITAGICSNDLDVLAATPIDGGYAVMVGSDNVFDYATIGLNMVGMKTSGPGSEFQWSGARFRGPWYDQYDLTQTVRPYAIIPDNRFGQTVRSMPNMTNTLLGISSRFGPTLLISAPNAMRGCGTVNIFPQNSFLPFTTSNSNSLPVYSDCGGQCPNVGRGLVTPSYSTIIGASIGDALGYADAAGDYNLDGSRDILCGAPGADRNGTTDGGIVYIIFGRPDFGGIDLALKNPPRMEIRGTNSGDQFGAMQTIVGDVNHDGVPDIGFASQYADGPGGVDCGFIGIVFGGRRLTGENLFSVSQVGTAQLPGCKIYGIQPTGHAGAIIANASDFNGDGTDDLLILAPNETRVVSNQTRRGVAYLLFGGQHLTNGSFNLAQVGTSVLPGAIFVSPYVAGTADEAPIDFVGAAGDANGDGFDDILVGVSTADYVNPLEPSQRRIDAGEAYLIYGSNTGSNAMR